MIDKIQSSDNKKFKTWLSLLTSKGIRSEGLFLLSGKKLIEEFLKKPNLEIVAEISNPKLSPLSSCKSQFELSTDLFKQLDELGTHFNILVLKTPSLPSWNNEMACSGLEIFCPLGDPSNLGALLRSAHGFSASKIILLKEAAHPYLPKSIKSSAGAVLTAPLYYGPSIKDLNLNTMIALSGTGKDLQQFKWPENVRLLVGEEGPGFSDLKIHTALSIKTNNIESLNAVVATAIALYSYRSQHGIK